MDDKTDESHSTSTHRMDFLKNGHGFEERPTNTC